MQFRCVSVGLSRCAAKRIQRNGRTARTGHKENSPFCRFQVYYVTVPLPMEGRLRMAARRSALQQSRLPGGDSRVLRLRAKLIPQHCNRQAVAMMHRCIAKICTTSSSIRVSDNTFLRATGTTGKKNAKKTLRNVFALFKQATKVGHSHLFLLLLPE